MTKADLINAIAEKSELSKKDSEKALNAAVASITEALTNGDKVQIVGFGTFEVRDKKEKEAINPRTKEKVLVPARKSPAFKAGKALKDAVDVKSLQTYALRRLNKAAQFFLCGGLNMRLDKYLKVTRLIKRRTVANEACDADKVLVNGKAARASYDVKVGDIIEICMGSKPLKVEVLNVSEYATKENASDNYRVIE